MPDNLKSGVSKASFFDPVLNPSYYALARHYGTAILPTRVRKPRDKAAVESAVLQVERWILAPLRHRAFFTLAELNAAIVPLREALNQRPLAPPRTGTRRSVFEADERARLRPLPADPYTIGQWELGRAVGADHHVIVDGHYYSVPSGLAHGRVDVFATATLVSLFQHGERVASHPRSPIKGGHSTALEHRPPGHRAVAGRTPEQMRAEQRRIRGRHRNLCRARPTRGIRRCPPGQPAWRGSARAGLRAGTGGWGAGAAVRPRAAAGDAAAHPPRGE